MKPYTWFRPALWLEIAAIVALLAVAVYADDKKAEEPKTPPANTEDGSNIDIRVPEAGPARAERGPRASEYWIGLELYPVRGALSVQLGLKEGQGLVVESVVPDSPAAKAGVKPHDILLAIGAKELTDIGDLSRFVGENKDKDLSLKVLRGGKNMTVTVTPAKRPEGRFLEGDHRLLGRLFDRELKDQGGDPIRMRFFHPGMVLPPGAFSERRFPDDLSITITKQGNEPASVEVKKGDQSWKVTTDDLAELPETVRGYAEQLLGRAPWADTYQFHIDGPGAQRLFRLARPFRPPAAVRPGAELLDKAHSRVERQLEEMNRRLEDMRKEMDQLRERRLPRNERQEGRSG